MFEYNLYTAYFLGIGKMPVLPPPPPKKKKTKQKNTNEALVTIY